MQVKGTYGSSLTPPSFNVKVKVSYKWLIITLISYASKRNLRFLFKEGS